MALTSDTPGKQIHLLLVEDDLPTQDFMMVALGRRFRILTAESADEARAVLSQERVDIILMDLSIKGEEDGIALTKSIRQHPAWDKIPIIALTAHAYDRDRENALAAGCNAYFSKPFVRSELLEEIQQLLVPST